MRYRYLAYKYTRRIQPDMVFQNVWESFGTWPTHPTIVWRPQTDIYETPDEIVVVIEAAGVAEEDLSITLFSDLLVVEGRREQPVTEMSACHQLGIKYGTFVSEIAIHASVDHNNVKARYTNGMLIISLRKLD